MLSACGEPKTDDLKAELATLKQTVATKTTKPATAIAVPKPAVYQALKRTPFEGTAVITKNSSQKKSLNPINAVSLDRLRFIGTISEDTEMMAVIVTPDDKFYQVKRGDTIGDHYGKIEAIYPDHLLIVESLSEDGANTTERRVTMQLKDKP